LNGLADAVKVVDAAWRRGLRPPPLFSLSEYADRHFKLGPKEVEPGPWRTARAPYLREPMDCLSPSSDIREVAVMKGAQLGFTKMFLIWLAYIIAVNRGEVMAILPKMKDTDTWLERQLGPMLVANPEVANLLDSPSKYVKKFGGFAFIATWSSSASGLKSNNAPFVGMDEFDSFDHDADGEGPPEKIVEYRQQNFANAKTLYISTPTDIATSKIYRAFSHGDKRRWFVPCPHCGHYQTLRVDRMDYGNAKHADDVAEVTIQCVGCRRQIEEVEKARWYDPANMLGVWIPTAKSPELVDAGIPAREIARRLQEKEDAGDPRCASFHIGGPAAPLGWDGVSWRAIIIKMLNARGNTGEEFSFHTHTLGEPVEVKGDMPEHRLIMARAEATLMEPAAAVFPGAIGTVAAKIPTSGLVLNATVDVQGAGYLACELRAWGRNRESWSVGWFLIDGDPAKAEVWKRLAAVVERQYPHELGGTLPLSAMAIDCGYRPEPVYDFARKYARPLVSGQSFRIVSPRTVIPVRGGADQVSLIQGWSTAQEAQKRFGQYVLTISGHMAKLSIYDRLRLDTPAWGEDRVFPRGYIHLPRYDEDYYRGVVAEKLVMAEKTGRLTWVKAYGRNEPLDCAVYHEGLAEVQQLSGRTEAQWASVERGLRGQAGELVARVERAAEPDFEVEPSYQDNW
jgi:phage terminase large subunit GpA-like protein